MMQPATRKSAMMPFELPAKRFLAGRQLIFEGVAPGTTKCMIAQFLRPYEVVDDESLDELESETSLRRTVLLTLKRGIGVEEAEEAISRLSGTVLNETVVTLRLFGKPASQATQPTSSQITEPFLSTPPSTPHLDTRRMTRAEARRRSMVLFTPEATPPLHSNATEDEPVMKLEREDAVIVTHQYDDVDIKQEPVENYGPSLPVITEDPNEENTTIATPATDPSIDDQTVNRTVEQDGNTSERASSSTIAATPQTKRLRKRRAPANFWAQERADSESFISTGTQTDPVHIFASATSGEDGVTPAVVTDLELALKHVDNYAGPRTADLEERFDQWVADSKQRDSNCLLCLRATNNDDLRCISCPRDYHPTCLKNACMQAGLVSHIDSRDATWFHCPLCLRRTWNVADPKERRRRRRVINRYSLARAFHANPNFRVWVQWEDTGTMISDQAILLGLDVMPDANEIRCRRQEANLKAIVERTWREKLDQALKAGLSRFMNTVFTKFPEPSLTLDEVSVHLCKAEPRHFTLDSRNTLTARERVILIIRNDRELPILYGVKSEEIAYRIRVHEETGLIEAKSQKEISVTLESTALDSWEDNDRRDIRVFVVALSQAMAKTQFVEYIDNVNNEVEGEETALAVAGDVFPLMFCESPQRPL